MKPVKICFISLNSYPLFNKNSLDYFGGAEVQISLITQALAKDKHFAVSLITGNYGQPPIFTRGRLKIYKTRLWDFLKILKTVNADIFVERTINPKVFLVGWWCRLFKKKFVYMAAHDWDCSYSGLKLAHLIFTQHQQQSAALKKNLNLSSIMMPPLVKIGPAQKPLERKYILWVGRADDWKRPLDFINLVRRNPQEKFVMICRPGKVKLKINLPNLIFIPAVPATKILDYFRQAKIFVNTSNAEGFPNTFLQAGAAKTPVLSFRVNPDNYLNKYHCGQVGQKLFQPGKDMGQNHYRYVKKYHGLKNLEIFKQTLCRL